MSISSISSWSEEVNEETIIKIDSILSYAMESRVTNVQKSIELAEEAEQKSKEAKYLKGVADSQNQLGLFNMILGQNAKGEEYAKLALEKYDLLSDINGRAEALYTLGSIHYKSAHHHLGLEKLLDSLKLQRQTENLQGQSRTLKAIGYIYETFEEYEKALETYLECRRISNEIGDKNGESNACNPLSGLYLKNKDFNNAFECINRSIKLKQLSGDKRGLGFAYYGKAKIHLKLKEYSDAEELFTRSLKIHKQVGEQLGTAMCKTKLGMLENKKKNFEKGRKHLLEAVCLGHSMNNPEVLYKAYFELYCLSTKEDKLREALDYHVLYHENHALVINVDTTSKAKSIESMWKMETLENEARVQKEKNTLAQKKNQQLDQFVSRVSHDLRGPVSSLLGLYQIVQKEVEDKTALKYFNLYNGRMLRLNQTITDLLELTKVNAHDIIAERIDFHELIAECLESFEYFPNYDNIRFEVNIDEGAEFFSDRRMINIILQNLLENSIKYSKSKDHDPYVQISVKQAAEDYLCLIVEDNGIGIDKRAHDKVFDMFYRANDEVQGSGLGMFILKSVLDRLDGEVSLSSELGVGTKFVVLLPIMS
jgi:signal transduction histidine kinase/tetratricopeptide (TPR) repeat protein